MAAVPLEKTIRKISFSADSAEAITGASIKRTRTISTRSTKSTKSVASDLAENYRDPYASGFYENEDEDEEDVESLSVINMPFQLWVAFIANFTMFSVGHCFSMSGYLIPKLQDEEFGLGINFEEASWFASLLNIGGLIGAIVGGLLGELLGRKRAILMDNVLIAIGLMLISFGPNLPCLLVGRGLLGYSTASACVNVPVYTSEACQPEVRGKAGLFTVLLYALGFGMMHVNGILLFWKYAVCAVAVYPAACVVLLIVFCPESPGWLISQGRHEAGRDALMKLRGGDVKVVDKEIQRIMRNIVERLKQERGDADAGGAPDGKTCRKDDQDGGHHLEQQQKPGQRQTSSFWRCLLSLFMDPTFLRPFVVLCVLVSLGCEMMGLSAIAFYMLPILNEAKCPINPNYVAVGLCCYRPCVALLTGPIVERIPRRALFFVMGSIMVLGDLIIGTFVYLTRDGETLASNPWMSWMPLAGILLAYTGYAGGMGFILFLIQGELLPSHGRSVGSGLMGFFDYLAMFLAVKTFPNLKEVIGIHGCFWVYACVGVFVIVFAYFCLPETKDKTLEDIEDHYREICYGKKALAVPDTKDPADLEIRNSARIAASRKFSIVSEDGFSIYGRARMVNQRRASIMSAFGP